MSSALMAVLVALNLVISVMAVTAVRLLRPRNDADQERLRSDELFAYDSWARDQLSPAGRRPRGENAAPTRRRGS